MKFLSHILGIAIFLYVGFMARESIRNAELAGREFPMDICPTCGKEIQMVSTEYIINPHYLQCAAHKLKEIHEEALKENYNYHKEMASKGL